MLAVRRRERGLAMGDPSQGKAAPRRRRPRQERSQALVDAILDATAELLARDGPARTTTNRVAERAGVSVGSIYQYFPDKQALFAALGERYVGELRGALDAVWPRVADATVDRIVAELLGALVAVSQRDAALSGMLHLTAIPARVFEPIDAFERDLEARAAELLTRHAARLASPPPDPALTARLLVRALGGLVGRTLASEPALIREPRFFAELIRLVRGSLGPLAET